MLFVFMERLVFGDFNQILHACLFTVSVPLILFDLVDQPSLPRLLCLPGVPILSNISILLNVLILADKPCLLCLLCLPGLPILI